MRSSILLTLLLFILFPFCIEGQSSYDAVQAKKLHKEGLYRPSCDLFAKSLSAKYDLEKTLLIAADACYQCAEYGLSRRFIGQIRNTQKKYNEGLFFQTARLFHLEGDYEKAAALYKEFLKKSSKRSDLREEVKRNLNHCWTALRMEKRKKLALIQNAGTQINSKYDDCYPLPSPTVLDKYYFSRNDEGSTGGTRDRKGRKDKKNAFYRLDILSAQLKNGVWSNIESIDPFFNSTSHDYIVDFSNDGQIMYYYQGLNIEGGSVLVDTFKSERSVITPRTVLNLNFGSDFDFINEDIVVFSADKKEGFGGKDLYLSVRKDGVWSSPKNLGPGVNGPGDEIRPFIAKNGRTLFFSTDDVRSMGGFDIMRSAFSSVNNEWPDAVNMGRGINSVRNDIDYRIASDGSLALFSSDRSEGIGGYDIFIAYLNDHAIEQLQSWNLVDLMTWYHGKSARPAKVQNSDKQQEVVTQEVTENKEVFRVRNIYFEDDDFIRKSSTKKEVDHIYAMMQRLPHAMVVLEGHLSSLTVPSRNLFFSAMYANLVKEKLIEKGIGVDRIVIKAYGGRRPLVDPTVVSSVAQKWNNRLHFRVIQSALDDGVGVEYEKAQGLDPNLVMKRPSDLTGLHYVIHLLESEQVVDNDWLLSQEGVSIHQRGIGNLTYVIGGLRTYSQAAQSLVEVRKNGFINAEIVPYIGEDVIDASDIEQISSRYPDLKDYLKDQ